MIKFATVCPHPPIIVPGVEDSQKHLAKKTIQAMDKLAQGVAKVQPGVIVLITPHGPMSYDKFTINLEEKFQGDFSNFGENQTKYHFYNNLPLAHKLLAYLRSKRYAVEPIRESRLDHGSLVPLHFLIKDFDVMPQILPLTFTALDAETHFEYGKHLGELLMQTEEDVLVVASGDLSHRLNEESPAGYSPYGIKFDETLTTLLKQNETEKILRLNPELCQEAGECGFRSILITLGAISHFNKKSFELLSYEGPFGVGYLVGYWKMR